MKKVACLLLIACFLFASCLFVTRVHASTSVGGLVSSDTTWDLAHSPYVLAGPVDVPEGLTLTIEPGVTIDLAAHYIQIDGTLIAKGTSSENIVLTSNGKWKTSTQTIEFMPTATDWNDQAQSGSIMENVLFNTTGVSIKGCSPKIDYDTFADPGPTAINVVGGNPSILDNTINLFDSGITADGGTIMNNHIKEGGFTCPITLSGDALFTGNVIDGGWDAVTLTGQVIFTGNTVMNVADIAVSAPSSLKIQQNYVANSKIGISGGGSIEGNTVTGNKIGIQCASSASTTVHQNNIYNNTQHNVALTGALNIDASNNWWGTSDIQAINQTIYDAKDDFNLGTATFVPILTSPSSEAPTAPGSVPSGTPEENGSPTPHTTETPTQPPNQSSLPIQNTTSPPLNQITNPFGGSGSAQLIVVVGLVAVAMAVAVCTIVLIRRRTLAPKTPARRRKNR